MNQQAEKSQIQTLAVGFIGFASVVGLGSLAIMRHGGETTKAPAGAYPPALTRSRPSLPSRLSGTSLSGAAPAASGFVSSSPAPVLSDEVRDADPPAQSVAASVAGGISGAPSLVAGRHLDMGSSASSSASASVDVSLGAKVLLASANKPLSASKPGPPKSRRAAATIHYGVGSRDELMGRAAGPVYNFSGRGLGQAQSNEVAAENSDQDTAGAAGAIQQVDSVQKQLDAADVPVDQKAKLDQNLALLRQTAYSAPAGQ